MLKRLTAHPYGVGHARLLKAERDYTRADDGKFSETSGGGGSKKTPPKKDTRTRQEIANQNRAQVAEQTGLGSDLDGAMARLDAGMGGAQDEAKADQLVERGLAVKDPNTGRYSLSPEGKRYYRAAKQGDVGAAQNALGAAKDRQAGRAARAKAQQERQTAAADRKTKTEAAAAERAKAKEPAAKKPKGGGAKGRPDPAEQQRQREQARDEAQAQRKERQTQEREQAAQQTAQRAGFQTGELEGLRAIAEGGAVANADTVLAGLAQRGLMARTEGGDYQLTPAGQKTLGAIERGDIRGVVAARQSAAPAARKPAARKFLALDEDRLAKATGDERLIYGIASTDTPDSQGGVWEGQRYEGDLVDPAAMAEAVTEYMRWGNIREMHDDAPPSAAGVALSLETIGGVTYLVAKVEDGGAWSKVRKGVYKGLSIGGKVLRAVLERLPDGRMIRRITKLLLTEISLVDRPANPEAAILLAKRETMNEDDETQAEGAPADPLAELARGGAAIAKAADPMKVVQQIQQLRNEAELAGDLVAAERYTQAIGLLLVGAGEAEDMAEDDAEGEAEAAEIEMAADDPAMADAAGALAMSSAAEVRKVGRKIAGARLAVMKRAFLDYAKVLAEAGDEDAATMLKALGSDPAAALKAAEASFTKLLQPVAAALLDVREQVRAIAAQPVAGGPVARIAGQPIAKRLTAEPAPAVVQKQAEPAHVAELRRLALTETHPIRKAQYEAELAKLAQ